MGRTRRRGASNSPEEPGRPKGQLTPAPRRSSRPEPAPASEPPEALYRTIFQFSPEGMVLADASGRILDVNRSLCRMLGYTPSELLGGNVRRFVPAENFAQVEGRLAVLRSGRPLEHEVWNQRKDGERCLVRLQEQPLRLPDGRPGVLIVARDVGHNRQGERMREVFLSLAAKLSGTRECREAARAIFAAADQLWAWDAAALNLIAGDPRLVETVLACDIVEGRRRELELVPVCESSSHFRRILTRGPELVLRPPGAPRSADTIFFGDQFRRSASIMAVPVRAESQAVGVLTIQSYAPNAYTPEDLRTLQALAEYCGGAIVRIRAEAESHRLGRQILQISEQEQARIGQDLHDGLCQNLVSLAFDAHQLQSTLVAQRRPEVRLARRLSTYLDQAITECRQVSRGLFPVRLAMEGLPAALEELVKASGDRFRTRCCFVCPQPVVVANQAVATHLYRIAQEALTNALRHSRARTVTVRLRVQAEELQLSVEDDGIGLPAAPQRSAKGSGLHIMSYRARTLGGTLHIGPGRRGGTRVICALPGLGTASRLPEG